VRPIPVQFSFAGEAIAAVSGQSVAAALTAAGHRVFRETGKGSPRGVFCGMGVCQDCLVTVDGKPNQRACMTEVRDGAVVEKQSPRPPLLTEPGRRAAPDVLVVGGGAGGLSAATAAAQAGAQVMLLDERKVAGGQYYKQAAGEHGVLDAQQAEGAELVARAVEAGVEIVRAAELWGVFSRPRLLASVQGQPLIIEPRTLIVATGAYERPCMVPGWTLPGVMTTGAAQTLWRSYRTLPGRRVAVVGSGPLNLQVALELQRGGAEVVAVAEAAPAPWWRPLPTLQLLSADPALAIKGSAMLAGLWRAGVSVWYGARVTRIEADGDALRVHLEQGGRTREITVDALCMNAGFEPQNEILRLLGADMDYDSTFGHLRTRRDDHMATSVAHVYAVGDCCGLGGAPAAVAEGEIAGVAAAKACGFTPEHSPRRAQAQLAKARRFQSSLWALHDPAPMGSARLDDATIVCRCEEVTAGAIRTAMADSADHAGVVKRATRAGMGCCQGRYCGPVLARLVAEHSGAAVEDHSFFAPRVPIKPVDIAAIRAAQEFIDAPA
jgi:NADPH-dependent 2,4-dienoyl-CoA reductase/sulfur reductase-like enzyme